MNKAVHLAACRRPEVLTLTLTLSLTRIPNPKPHTQPYPSNQRRAFHRWPAGNEPRRSTWRMPPPEVLTPTLTVSLTRTLTHTQP